MLADLKRGGGEQPPPTRDPTPHLNARMHLVQSIPINHEAVGHCMHIICIELSVMKEVQINAVPLTLDLSPALRRNKKQQKPYVTLKMMTEKYNNNS